jgi:hypothetical protein
MAAKRRSPKTPNITVGPRGLRGRTGPAGPTGRNHTAEIARLSAQVAQIVKELQVQLTRIAQIQIHWTVWRRVSHQNRKSAVRQTAPSISTEQMGI